MRCLRRHAPSAKSKTQHSSPMFVVKVSDFMQLTGPPPSFEELSESDGLTEWEPSCFTVFVAHEWLGLEHPDPQGVQSHCLRMALFNILTSAVKVEFDVLAQSMCFNRVLNSEEVEKIRDGYLWMDWMCLPQDTLTHTYQDLTCSVPDFVERSELLVVLAPKLHNTRGQVCSYETLQRRGWCRAEMWFKHILLQPEDLPMLLIAGEESVKFLRGYFLVHSMVQEGDFSMESDRGALCLVMKLLLQTKLRHVHGDEFRFLKARFEAICGERPRHRGLEEFLEDFGFGSVRQRSGLGPLACAVLSNDVALLRTLVQKKARLDCRARDMQEFDIIAGLTPLHLAAKHSCNSAAIMELLDLKADVNEVDSLGTSALGHAGTKEVVRLLLDQGAAVNQRRAPFGMPSLSASILRPLEPEGLALMIEARAEVNAGAGMYSFSPLTTAVLFPGMPYAMETVELLLSSRADVNYREGFYKALTLLARACCRCQKTPPALLKGIAGCCDCTPVFVAAWFGNAPMVNALLEARADPDVANSRGHTYLDVLNQHSCATASSSLTWHLQGQKRWSAPEPPPDSSPVGPAGPARRSRSKSSNTSRRPPSSGSSNSMSEMVRVQL